MIDYELEDYYREHAKEIVWDLINYTQEYSLDFYREFKDKINWRKVLSKRRLSVEMIEEFVDKFNFLKYNEELVRNVSHQTFSKYPELFPYLNIYNWKEVNRKTLEDVGFI